jgi:GAF domain-containing protein/CheY-like chemotaxis protein
MEERAPLILAADADDDRRRIVGDILRRAGFGVLIAASGADALRLATAEPDLVILAAGLPDLDALEVGHRIRASQASIDLPIIHLFASYPRLKERIGGLRPGADAYLAGPVQAEELTSTVRALLAVRRTSTELRRRRRITEALVDLSVLLPKSLEPASVAQRIADSACSLLDVRTTAVYELGPSAKDLVRLACAHDMPVEPAEVLPGGTGVSWVAITRRRTVAIPNVLGDPSVTLTPELRAWLEHSGCGAGMAVPLLTTERVVGALFVADRLGRAFTDEEIALAETFANHAAIALENARLYQEAEQRRAEAEALARTAKVLTTTLDVPVVSQRIVESVLSLFAVEVAILSIGRPDGGLLVTASGGPARTHYPPGIVFPPGPAIASRAFAAGRPIWSPDIQAERELGRSEDLRRRICASGVHGALGVPLAVEGRVIGVLSIADRAVRNFSSQEIALLQAFGDQAAVALENARLYEQTERARREAEVLGEIASALNASLDLDEILKTIVTAARTLTGAERATIARWDSPREAMTFRYHAGPTFAGLDSLQIEPGRGAGGYVLETGRPFRTDDYAGDSRITKDYAQAVAAYDIVAVVIVPIVSGGQVQGLVYVANRSPRTFTAEDETILVRLADHAAIAVTNAQLYAAEKAARAEAQAAADALRIRVAQQAAVAELGQRALSDEDLATLMADAAAVAARNLSADYSEILELVSDGAGFLLRAGFGWSGGEGGRARRPGGAETPAGVCVQFGEPVVIEDGETDPRFSRSAVAADYGIVSSAVVVIEGLIPPFGVLAVHARRRRTFSADDISYLNAVAHVLGLAMLRKRTEDLFRQHADRLAILREVDEAILAAESPQAIAEAALRHLLQLVPSWRASVALFDLEHSIGTVFASVGAGAHVFPPGTRIPFEPADIAELRNGDVRVVQDTSTDPRSTALSRDLVARGTRGFVRLPLAVEGRLMGSLTLAADRPNFFTAEHVEIAREAAKPLALALHHARLRNEMREGRERLQALSRRLVNVQEEERRRLARDLHDEIGQILTGLKFTLASSDRDPDAAVRADLSRATDLVSDLIGRIRDLSLDLRPSMLDDLGLVPALLFHVDRYTAQTKVRVRMEHSGIERQRFPREIETAAYRIVQEALTNVARHAGVEAAVVRVWTSGAALGVQIVDEGCGFDSVGAPPAHDGGLAGMRERAALLGGQLDVESAVGAGVRITATLPLAGPLERRRAPR